jgi:hypothetical protein
VIIDSFGKLRITTDEPVLIRAQSFYETYARHLDQAFTAVFAEGEDVFGR